MPLFKLMQDYIPQVSNGLLTGCVADRLTYQANEIEAGNLKPIRAENEIGLDGPVQVFVWRHADLSASAQICPGGNRDTRQELSTTHSATMSGDSCRPA